MLWAGEQRELRLSKECLAKLFETRILGPWVDGAWIDSRLITKVSSIQRVQALLGAGFFLS